MKHALLSPSGAHRWMNCTPSARLEETFPDTAGQAAAEGTLAHEIAELKIRRKFLNSDQPGRMDELKQDPLYQPEMQTYTDAYVEYIDACAMRYEHSPLVAVETKVDFSAWVPEGFGVSDCILLGDHSLHVIDLKYGKGVPVSAIDNPQIRLYALGAINLYSLIYDIQTVSMSIVQPRLDSITEDTMTVSALLQWAETEVRPAAEMAYKGEGVYKAGDWCRFCKARKQCAARAQEMEIYMETGQALLDNGQIGAALTQAEPFLQWVKDLKEHALQSILDGATIPGWKVVEGRSIRVFTDEDVAFQVLRDNGFDDTLLYKPREHITLSETEKLIGRKQFNRLCGPFVEKPRGKPTLVQADDKRPAYDTAKDDFDFMMEVQNHG